MSTKSVRDIIAQIEAVMAARVGECSVSVHRWGAAWWCGVRRASDGVRVAETAHHDSERKAVHDLARILGVDL